MADTISEQMTFLKSNDELRRELVANVSHDFKSPITSLQGNLQLLELQYDSLDDEQRRKRIQNAAKCTEVLDRRIKEFCELSELEAKKVVPEISVFSITELITEELIPRFQARADERALVLRADCPDTLPSVRGDCHLVERVLTNLLENAINYANEGTEVLVRVQQENELEKLRISVEDTGKGIPEEELGKIFNRHYRGLRSRDLTGGSGLGLAIVKEIVEAHGESITVTSAQGRTRFSFNLPISGLQRFE